MIKKNIGTPMQILRIKTINLNYTYNIQNKIIKK